MSKPMTFLKKDKTEDIKAEICDNICIHSHDVFITQDELDDRCARCIVDSITSIKTQ